VLQFPSDFAKCRRITPPVLFYAFLGHTYIDQSLGSPFREDLNYRTAVYEYIYMGIAYSWRHHRVPTPPPSSTRSEGR
jgi:hypothetical protein